MSASRTGLVGDSRSPLASIAARASLHWTEADRLELLHRGDDHFDRVEVEIAHASREVCAELFQVRNDAVGVRLRDALVAAADRGLEVRFLLDPVGSRAVHSWLGPMRASGVDVRWYNPVGHLGSPLRRTHRKLLIFDGRIASIGGVNFGREFSEAASGASAWRDMSVWLRGPVANVMRRQFEAAWVLEGLGPPLPSIDIPGASTSIPCAVAGGWDGRTGHAETYETLADLARDELLLATPYFIPSRRFQQAIEGAARRGVRVVVTIPRFSDISWFKHGGRRVYDRLLRSGIEIRERLDRMVHAKVAVVDRRVAAVGSVNLNRLSFAHNSETLMLTEHQPTVAAVTRFLALESSFSAEFLTPGSWRRHPDRRRLAEWAASTAWLL